MIEPNLSFFRKDYLNSKRSIYKDKDIFFEE